MRPHTLHLSGVYGLSDVVLSELDDVRRRAALMVGSWSGVGSERGVLYREAIFWEYKFSIVGDDGRSTFFFDVIIVDGG